MMADEQNVQEFPRVLYKHRDPLTVTVNSQEEQDKYIGEGYSLNHRPQEQIDQEQYLKDNPDSVPSKGEPSTSGAEAPEGVEPHEALKESDAHDYKADIVKPEEGTV